MTIATARTWIRDFARNAGDSTEYSDARVDRALQFVGSRFVRVTRCTRTTSNLTITSGSSAITASAVTNFRAEYLFRAYIPAQGELQIIDHEDLLDLQVKQGESGLPTFIAFTSTNVGEVYPTPDAAYTAKLLWYEPFTTWTAGSAPSPDSFNVPDEWLKEILTYGVPAALQHNEVEHLYASESWKKYLSFETELTGAGGFGEKTLKRQTLRGTVITPDDPSIWGM